MGIWIGLGVFAAILYIVMTAMMIIFERDKPKNIILWSSIFLVTQIDNYYRDMFFIDNSLNILTYN